MIGMSAQPPEEDPESEALLSKADALIRRNRPDGVGSDAAELPVLTDAVDELPELTEEVYDLEASQLIPIALPSEPQPIKLGISENELEEAVARAVERARMQVAEQLIDLDARIGQALDAWINTELPQLMASEMGGMVERLRVKTLAHLHATLIPSLSENLSEVLDAALKKK